MRTYFFRTLSAAVLVFAVGAMFAFGKPSAQEQRYTHAFFKINGYALKDPSRGYCGSHCNVPNPQLNSTYIHSPIFKLPERDAKVDLWETGKEFCRRARRQMGEGWWKQKGMPECIDGATAYYYSEQSAVEELSKLYARAKKETRPDYLFEVFEFADFQPKHVQLFVIRFPGSVPAPVNTSPAVRQPAQLGSATASPARPATSSVASAAPLTPPTPPRFTAEQELAEIALREKLNRDQAAFAARQLAENDAAKQAFAKANAEREATIARQQAEHRAAVAAVEAEKLRLQREHEDAMAKWRADVAACEAGDKTRCKQE